MTSEEKMWDYIDVLEKPNERLNYASYWPLPGQHPHPEKNGRVCRIIQNVIKLGEEMMGIGPFVDLSD